MSREKEGVVGEFAHDIEDNVSEDFLRRIGVDIGTLYQEWNRSKTTEEDMLEGEVTERHRLDKRAIGNGEYNALEESFNSPVVKHESNRKHFDDIEEGDETCEEDEIGSVKVGNDMIYQVDYLGQVKMFEQDESSCNENRRPAGVDGEEGAGEMRVESKAATPINLCVSK